MADEWCEEGAGLQRKQRKRGCIHQIKIPEYSTDQQNHTQLSSPHISLYFQDMWSSRFWRPNISPPARCEREKTISRNPAFIPLTALFIITAALVLSFFPPHLHSFIFQRLIVHITTSDVAPVSWVNPTPMLHILHMQHRHISTFRQPLGWALHAIPYTQCVWVLSRVRRFVTPWTLAPHGLQPTRLLCPWNFLGKTTGVGCHFPIPGDLPDPKIEPESLASPALAGGFFFTTRTTWEAPHYYLASTSRYSSSPSLTARS